MTAKRRCNHLMIVPSFCFYPAKFLFAYRHKVVFCLAFRVIRHFQTHCCTRQQQFLAPPGVFDMDGFHRTVHIHMGNKTVGTIKKDAVHNLSVFQCLLRFHFCLIHLRRPGIKAAEDDLHLAVSVALQPIRHCIHCNLGGGIQRIAIHTRRNCQIGALRCHDSPLLVLFGFHLHEPSAEPGGKPWVGTFEK